MSISYPSPSLRYLGALSGAAILGLALGLAGSGARGAERAPSPAPSHSTRDLGKPAATGLETCPGSSAPSSNAGARDAATGSGPGLTAGSRGTPAAGRAHPNVTGKASERPAGNRVPRRSGDGRAVPPAPLEEPRRGGVGTLIGISLA